KVSIKSSIDKFKRLSDRADSEPSISNIRRLIDESKVLFDEEINRIAQAVSGTKERPRIKDVETFQIKNVAKKAFLETEDDVDEFVQDLSKELKKAIKNEKRIRIE
ncbi:MAG: hypothetical protein ABTQ25_16280, partial [Nitrosomonas ureae]